MKKNILHLILIVISFFLCSCIDEYHIVKKNGNGYDIGLIVKIPQYLVKKANDENGGDVIKDMEKEIRKEYGKDVKIERGSKDENYILNASFYVDEKSNSKVKKMLPRKKGNQVIIPLDYSRKYDKKNEEGASYGNPTYALFIEKQVAPLLKSAEIRRKNGNSEEIDFKKDDDVYIITIPLKRLLIKHPFVEVVLTMEDEKKYVSDYLKATFGTYMKLQDAFFSEERNIGSLNQIGMLNDGGYEYYKPYFHSYTLHSPISLSPKIRCSEYAEWKMRSILSNGQLCYEVILPNEPECNFVSSLCQYATAEKCGYTCPESDVPSLEEFLSFLEMKKNTSFLQCGEDEFLYWRPMEETCGYRNFPDTCISLPKHAHKVNRYMKTETDGSVDLVNNFSWECDLGYSRDRGDSCVKWPKRAIKSKQCWISSIDTMNLKKIYPNLNRVTVSVDNGEGGYSEMNVSLYEAVFWSRGNIAENAYLDIDGTYKEYKRTKLLVNVDPQNTALGPYSGCWKCPDGSEYDEKKHECVIPR